MWYVRGPRRLRDDHGRLLPDSISEKSHVNINGLRQGMFIKGRDAGNPVLLYLHGGMPDYFLTERYPTGSREVLHGRLVGTARLGALVQRRHPAARR